jgi:hypothetical protein
MRKVLTLVALAMLAAGSLPALASSHCEDDQQRSQADPFGGCESASGDVTCDGATDAPQGVGVYADPFKGVALCIDDESDLSEYEGRYGVARDGGRLSVYADMGDGNELNGAVLGTDWVRADTRPNEPDLCVYRGGEGSAWMSGSAHDPSAEQMGDRLLAPLDPATAPIGGNPAPGLGEDGFSQCFVFGNDTLPDPDAIPTGMPSP